MKRYVGLDVSQATTAICVVDEEGKTLPERVTATESAAIAAFVRRRAPDAVRIGMETGPLAVWLWNELRALELPMVCMDARHANAGLKVMLAKTDRNDPGPPRGLGLWSILVYGRQAAACSSASWMGSPSRNLMPSMSWPRRLGPFSRRQ